MRDRVPCRASALAICLAVACAGTVAVAQPGATPGVPLSPAPGAPAPPHAIQPPSAQSAPGPYFYLLTPDEQRLVLRGEISQDRIIGGGLVGMFMGMGLGHAVQGRYREKGYIFTLGEIGSVTALMLGLFPCLEGPELDDGSSCTRNAQRLAIAGLFGIIVFRTWELVDVWGGAASYNERVRAARAKSYGQVTYPGYSLYLAPTSQGSGGVAGLTVRF